jgi:hypothetical protein
MIRAALLALTFLFAPALTAPVSAQAGLPMQPVQPVASAGLAETDPALFEMLSAMGIYDILSILSQENMQSGNTLEASMFPGEGGADWAALVARLHEGGRMSELMEDAFPTDALTPDQVAEVTRFMTSDTGRRVVAAEVETRLLFLDADHVDIATESFMAAMEARDGRLELLYQLNEVNGYIERNVSGALNLRFAFFRGLADGGAFDDDMAEDTMLQQVWSEEEAMRQMTIEWLFSYQLAAYAGFSDAELQSYIDFGRSEAGRAVNAALFASFDEMLGTLSYELGRGAAGFILGEDT